MWRMKSSSWRVAAGGAHAINSAKEPLHNRLLELTEGRGPDVVIEAIGSPATFRAAVEEVAFTGGWCTSDMPRSR